MLINKNGYFDTAVSVTADWLNKPELERLIQLTEDPIEILALSEIVQGEVAAFFSERYIKAQWRKPK
jgi:hypothetical protein